MIGSGFSKFKNLFFDDSFKWTEVVGVVFALLMVVAAYYPTLVGDYVPQDQWRVFKHSPEPGFPKERWDACALPSLKQHFLRGRWLVWIGECAEHAAVAQIRDLTPLRLIALAVVLLCLIAIRDVLNDIFNFLPVATVLAVMVVLTPGYAFMYYQGLTGVPVLLALLFSLLSFPFVSRALTTKERNKKFYFDLRVGGFLFVIACFLYPAFAFSVISLAFIFSAFRPNPSFPERMYLCAKLFGFYAVASLIYYLTVKLSFFLVELAGKPIPDLGIYRVDMTTDPKELMRKSLLALQELMRMPWASFLKVPAWFSLPFLLGPAGLIFFEGQRLGWGRNRSIIAAFVYLLSIPVIIVASVAPWILSHFPGAPYRSMLPIHFLLILSFGILITFAIAKIRSIYGEKNARQAGWAVMMGLVGIFSINQISLSQLQVIDSTIEINHMRASYREMIESGKFWDLKEIHIIRPQKGRHYNGQKIDREFSPATMENPSHIMQMTHAVLREMLSPEQLKRIHLVDCRFDRDCVHSAPESAMVISQSKFAAPLPKLQKNHAIIDYSLLNKKPKLIKAIKVDMDSPIVASSQHKDYSPAHLLETTGQNIWHSERNPQYPQWVQFKYSSPKGFSILSIRAQGNLTHDLTSRAPKDFMFQASNDAKNWIDLIEVKDAGFNSEKFWQTFKFKNDKEYIYYRIYILANGGDSILTIRQIALN